MTLVGRSFAAQEEIANFAQSGFDDRSSSVEVLGGWFEACQGGAFTGPRVMLRPGKYPSLRAMGLDDRISSVRMQGREGARLDVRDGSNMPYRSNITGTTAGALLGGILGHPVGDGRGRDRATEGGAVAGGAIGTSLGRDAPDLTAGNDTPQRLAPGPGGGAALQSAWNWAALRPLNGA